MKVRGIVPSRLLCSLRSPLSHAPNPKLPLPCAHFPSYSPAPVVLNCAIAGRCARALLRGVGCALLLHHLWRLGHWQRAAEGRRRRRERLLRHPWRVRAGHWPGRVRDPGVAPPFSAQPTFASPPPLLLTLHTAAQQLLQWPADDGGPALAHGLPGHVQLL